MSPMKVSQSRLFSRIVSDCMDDPPPVLSRGTTCQDAVRTMREHGASMAVIGDNASRIVGILTDRDVSHRIAFRVPPTTPVSEVMSRSVHSVHDDDYVFHAIAVMRRTGLRQFPVLDRRGRICGVLHLNRALAETMPKFMELVEQLTHEESIRGLKEIKSIQVQLVEMLSREGVTYPEIQNLLTHINNDIYRRIVEQSLVQLDEDGWGPPPVAFDVIVMGSGGRGESFLFPDQDNGFVLADYPAERHTTVDAYFSELAETMTEGLDAVGFTLCRGHVMATNPLWRKTLSEWREQLFLWLSRPKMSTLRLGDIFFDFRCVYGSGDLATSLREFVTDAAAKHHRFLQEMQQVQEEHGVALGVRGKLSAETSGDEKGKLNLKYHALLPLVESIRLLALRNRVAATPTLSRIEGLKEQGVLSEDEQDYLAGAFSQLTTLVLREQTRDFVAGRTVGSSVAPDALSEREKDSLVANLKAINGLRERIKSEFTARIF